MLMAEISYNAKINSKQLTSFFSEETEDVQQEDQ